MFEGYKLKTAEREAIEKAFALVDRLCQYDYRNEQFVKDEARGYGRRSDRVPLIAAKALAVKWFRRGVNYPAAPLADTFDIRPAAIWFQGYGARVTAGISAADLCALDAAVTAHNAVFDRMLDADTAALNAPSK